MVWIDFKSSKSSLRFSLHCTSSLGRTTKGTIHPHHANYILLLSCTLYPQYKYSIPSTIPSFFTIVLNNVKNKGNTTYHNQINTFFWVDKYIWYHLVHLHNTMWNIIHGIFDFNLTLLNLIHDTTTK